jgi:hypothetical protein
MQKSENFEEFHIYIGTNTSGMHTNKHHTRQNIYGKTTTTTTTTPSY